MKNCILGNGEVANALRGNLYGEVISFDKGEWEGKTLDCDILHIAIPYTEKFVNICESAEKVFSPDYTIIHSTVKPGTSRRLKCLYSPVLGRHSDDFQKNVAMYRKFVAGNLAEYEKVKEEMRLTCEYWGPDTDELEYSKVMSTTQMYWYLLFNKYLQNDCERRGFDYSQVYFRWLDNYNAGIRNNHPKWERPIYNRMETDIPGGHCLPNNIHLVDNEITSFLQAYQKEILYFMTREGSQSANRS